MNIEPASNRLNIARTSEPCPDHRESPAALLALTVALSALFVAFLCIA